MVIISAGVSTVMMGGHGLKCKIRTQTECTTGKVSPRQHIGLQTDFDLGNTESEPGLIIGDGNMSIWFE